MSSAIMSSAMPSTAPAVLSTLLEAARHHHAQNRLLLAAEAYRQALQSDPHSQLALLGLSLIARQSNQLQAAFHMAQAALAANPNSSVAWSNLGDLLTAAAKYPQARQAFQRALALEPGLGAAHYGLANTFALQDDFTTALPSFQAAAALAPNLPEFHFAQAFAQGKLGQHPQAILSYRRAVTLRPSFASAWLNLGVELIADGRDQLAALCYQQALAAADNPGTRISTHLNVGHLYRGRRDFSAAGKEYEEARILAQSSSPSRLGEVHVANTYLHLEQIQFPLSWQSLHAAEAADPAHQNAEIPNVRGILLLAEDSAMPTLALSTDRERVRAPHIPPLRCGTSDRIEAAIESFQQAESQGHKTAASNRGNAYLRLGRCQEALRAHRARLKPRPHHPGVRYNLALTQLRLGDFAQGWPNYEIRWQFREVHPHPRRFQQPRWQGEPLSGAATLLIYAEQGLGDTIQFARYLTLVAQRLSLGKQRTSTHLILEVQPPLTRLLAPYLVQLSIDYPEITAQILPHGEPLPDFTHHCPLMSLPAIFQTTLETIPASIPYLVPPSEQSTEPTGAPSFPRPLRKGWASRHPLSQHRPRLGRQPQLPRRPRPLHNPPNLPPTPPNPQHPLDLPAKRRSRRADLPNPSANSPSTTACSGDRDLADTAALIANLDLVVTTDTAIAHLAGALGKPLWLLLPWQSDWRWMQETPHHPLVSHRTPLPPILPGQLA